MITARYYYNKLSQKDKKIYKAIYDGIMNYQPYVEVPGIDLNENKVGLIYQCILWDNPFIFSVGEYAMWHALSADKSRVNMTTLCDSTTEKKYRKEIENAVNQILSVPGLKKMSDFQKEVFVHDFILNNVEYDKTLGNNGKKIQPYTVYGALVEHKAVCEGIAKTVKLLLNMLDVKCIVVSGQFEGNAHAWNIVKLDDWSYNLDATMDLGRVVHPGMMRYNYFNFRDGDISSYQADNAHVLPECKAIKYNYVVKAGGYVSNYERLKKYLESGLSKKKSCLYFKINKNVKDEFSNTSFKEFQNIIKKAYGEVSRSLGISTCIYMDATGPGEIVNIEVNYS